MKLLKFAKYKFIDFKADRELKKQGIKKFTEYGLRLYSGAQGGGKTMSMVHQLEEYRHEFPGLCIATNFGYTHEHYSITSIEEIPQLVKAVRDLDFTGLVIGWDEIQNDFDNQVRTYPISILRTITQQRKQAIKILATSQVFTRVGKAIREQTFEVVQCKTFAGRWTFQKWYDPVEYEHFIQNPDREKKLRVKKKINFVQTDDLRNKFDSYAVINSLERVVELDTSNIIQLLKRSETA